MEQAFQARQMDEAGLPLLDRLVEHQAIKSISAPTLPRRRSARAQLREKLRAAPPTTWKNVGELDQIVTAHLDQGRAATAAEILEAAYPPDKAPWDVVDRAATLRLHLGEPEKAVSSGAGPPRFPGRRFGTHGLPPRSWPREIRAGTTGLRASPQGRPDALRGAVRPGDPRAGRAPGLGRLRDTPWPPSSRHRTTSRARRPGPSRRRSAGSPAPRPAARCSDQGPRPAGREPHRTCRPDARGWSLGEAATSSMIVPAASSGMIQHVAPVRGPKRVRIMPIPVSTIVLVLVAALPGSEVGPRRGAEPEDPGVELTRQLADEVRAKGWIVYSARSGRGDWDLFACRPDGSENRNITDTRRVQRGGAAVLARRAEAALPPPPGRAIDRRQPLRHPGRAGDRLRRRLGPDRLGGEGEYPWASWSPDGEQVACLTDQGHRDRGCREPAHRSGRCRERGSSSS